MYHITVGGHRELPTSSSISRSSLTAPRRIVSRGEVVSLSAPLGIAIFSNRHHHPECPLPSTLSSLAPRPEYGFFTISWPRHLSCSKSELRIMPTDRVQKLWRLSLGSTSSKRPPDRLLASTGRCSPNPSLPSFFPALLPDIVGSRARRRLPA